MSEQLGSNKVYSVDELSAIKNKIDILETFDNPHLGMDYLIKSETDEFTAVCPVTGQPDWGTITIETVPDRLCVELKSLKMYLMSYRNDGIFHEKVTGDIAKDIISKISPKRLKVIGQFSVRGGIGTTVVFEYPQK